MPTPSFCFDVANAKSPNVHPRTCDLLINSGGTIAGLLKTLDLTFITQPFYKALGIYHQGPGTGLFARL